MLFTYEKYYIILHKLIFILFTTFPKICVSITKLPLKNKDARLPLFKSVAHCTDSHNLQFLAFTLPNTYFFLPFYFIYKVYPVIKHGSFKNYTKFFPKNYLFQHQKYILWYGQNFTGMSKYSYLETEKSLLTLKCKPYDIVTPFLSYSTKLLISLKVATTSFFISWWHLAQSLSIASFSSYCIILETYFYVTF